MNIYDIAKLSGVSIATVSRVLNGAGSVSEKTRRKVEAVMLESGYTPNVFARGLGLDSMKLIGVLCTDVSDSFYASAVSVIENELRAVGYSTVLICTGNGRPEKRQAMEQLLAKRVDAVILVGSAFQEGGDNRHIIQAAEQMPVFVINGLIELENVFCILCNEEQAVRDNTNRLIRQGCRRILYLYDADTYSGMQKLNGYRKGYADAGLEMDDRLIVKTEKTLRSAGDAVRSLYQNGAGFDAVETSEDLLAVGAMKALEAPMPVIGFNNSVLAECVTPELTSVDNQLEAMCETAVSLLVSLFAGKKVPAKMVLDPRLVERESWNTGK